MTWYFLLLIPMISLIVLFLSLSFQLSSKELTPLYETSGDISRGSRKNPGHNGCTKLRGFTSWQVGPWEQHKYFIFSHHVFYSHYSLFVFLHWFMSLFSMVPAASNWLVMKARQLGFQQWLNTWNLPRFICGIIHRVPS